MISTDSKLSLRVQCELLGLYLRYSITYFGVLDQNLELPVLLSVSLLAKLYFLLFSLRYEIKYLI